MLLIIGVVSYFSCFSQNNDQMSSQTPVKVYFPISLEAGGDLWYPITSFALKNNFGGVYFAHAAIQHQIYKGLYAGLELQNGQISEVTPQTYRIAIATTNLFAYNAGLKVSYYSDESGDWFFSASITAGGSWLAYNKLPANGPMTEAQLSKKVFFLNPCIRESLKVNDELRIGLEIMYSYYPYNFSPYNVGITQTYSDSQLSGPMTYLAWGFNLTYFLGRAKAQQ